MKVIQPAMTDYDIQTMRIRNTLELHHAREQMGEKYNGHPAMHVQRVNVEPLKPFQWFVDCVREIAARARDVR